MRVWLEHPAPLGDELAYLVMLEDCEWVPPCLLLGLVQPAVQLVAEYEPEYPLQLPQLPQLLKPQVRDLLRVRVWLEQAPLGDELAYLVMLEDCVSTRP